MPAGGEEALEIPEDFAGVPLATRPSARRDAPKRNIFAEHPLRAAIVTSGVYYARDRRPLVEPVPDAIRGGELHALPTRLAKLGNEGGRPAYRIVAERIVAGSFAGGVDRASTGIVNGAPDAGATMESKKTEAAATMRVDGAAQAGDPDPVWALEAALAEFLLRAGATDERTD